MSERNNTKEFVQQKTRKQRRKGRKKTHTPTPKSKPPAKPSFASILKPDVKDSDNNTSTVVNNAEDEPGLGAIIGAPENKRNRRLYVNYVPPTGNIASYDTWCFSYFPYLVRLRDEFARGVLSSDANVSEEWLYSLDFLEDFCQFVFENSSGYVSPHLEEMDDNLSDYYWQFMIKRNEK